MWECTLWQKLEAQPGIVDIGFYDKPAFATGAKSLPPVAAQAKAMRYAVDDVDSAPR